jgi:hypothetical protein
MDEHLAEAINHLTEALAGISKELTRIRAAGQLLPETSDDMLRDTVRLLLDVCISTLEVSRELSQTLAALIQLELGRDDGAGR